MREGSVLIGVVESGGMFWYIYRVPFVAVLIGIKFTHPPIAVLVGIKYIFGSQQGSIVAHPPIAVLVGIKFTHPPIAVLVGIKYIFVS